MNLKIKDILKATNGVLLTGNEDRECEDFLNDTRKIKKGDTFIGIKGANFDGNLFWKEALDKGADTVIVEKIDKKDIEKYNDKNIIQVENTREALKQIATEKRNLYKNLIVIGVTGSSGKTSTKDIIANVLSQKYKTLKTEGNYNNDVGLPMTILRLKDHEVAVIEMGMNHLGEISELSKIAQPTISVITNVGTSHIGNLGSRENILKAKLEILDGMDTKKLIINNDNDLLDKWNNQNKNVDVFTFGIENKSDCMAENIVKHEENIEFICDYNNEKIKLNMPIGNEIFIYNSLCATLIGKLLNLNNEEIQNGISSMEITKKRMEIIKLKNDIILINDSYNANPDSMSVAIKYLAGFNEKRKIAVLGDMLELGAFSEELHRQVGNKIAKENIDLLFLVGNDSEYIKQGAIENGMPEKSILCFATNEELLEEIKKIMQKNDVFLFKASNLIKLFNVVEKLKELN